MWHGCAHIAGLYPDRSATHDFLTYGAGLVKGLGFDTIKLEFSIGFNQNKYPGQTFGSPTTMKQLAQEAAFHSVFSDSAFARYWLSCFSLVVPENNPWGYAWTDEKGDAMEQEFFDLCAHLLATYSNKEFILANWEGDWQLLLDFAPQNTIKRSTFNAYCDWHRRRQNAMKRARAANPSSTTNLIYSIETNRVLDGWGPRLHSDVVPRIGPDMVSSSCYEVIEGWHLGLSQAALEADIEAKLEELVKRIRVHHSGPIALSEFGWPIYNSGFSSRGYDSASLLDTLLTKAASLGIVGEIYWQILDNEQQAPGVPYGFGLYDRNGNSTTVGGLNPLGLYYQGIL